MGRWRVHRWTLLARNGQSQMLCQFDDDLLGGSIEVCDAKATNLPRVGWFRFGGGHRSPFSTAPATWNLTKTDPLWNSHCG